MAVPYDQDFQTQLEADYSAVDVDYRRSLYSKLIFLLDNVDPDHKNSLIVSKIRNQGYERFDRARSLVEEYAYYRYFLATLDTIELEKLLLVIKPGLELNARTSPKTSAAYNYVYLGAPMPSTKLVVEEAVSAFSGVFRESLKSEALRQHEQAIADNPGQQLAESELNQCGKPLNAIFKFYIPKLADGYMQSRFNAIIRKTIRDPNLSTYDQQVRLRHTAMRMADALENNAAETDAFNLRAQVFGREFAEKCRQANAKRNSITTNQPQAISLNKLFDLLKSILSFKFPFKAAPEVQIPQINTNLKQPLTTNYDPNAAQQLQELADKISRLQQQHEDYAKTPMASKPDLMFNFNARNKPQPFSLPEVYPPRGPRLTHK